VQRTRYAQALVDGDGVGRSEALDASALARKHGRGKDLEDALSFYVGLLLGRELAPEWRERLTNDLSTRTDRWQVARQAVALLLSTPEAQLG
jgi:hypothetical protein